MPEKGQGKWGDGIKSDPEDNREGVKVERFHVHNCKSILRRLLKEAIEVSSAKTGRVAKPVNKVLQRCIEQVEFLDDLERGFEETKQVWNRNPGGRGRGFEVV